jgi:hypothetical protein
VLTGIVRAGLASGGYLLETALRFVAMPVRMIGIGGPDRPPVRAGEAGTVVADGSPNVPPFAERGTTVRFALDGQAYEIDLSAEAADGLRAAFRPYIDAGRPAENGIRAQRRDPGRAGELAPTAAREDAAAIRTWARAHGHRTFDRGRIPVRVLEAYRAAK